MKTLLLALSAPLIGTVGQLLLKHVMTDVGPIGMQSSRSAGAILLRLPGNTLFAAAVLRYCLGFVIWLVVFSKLDLSFAYPLLALSYYLTPALSQYYLGEQISPRRWVGISTICDGVGVVGISK